MTKTQHLFRLGLFAGSLVLLSGLLTQTASAATPIWTDHNESDPGVAGRHAPGEKGGTTDINIGVGELKRDNNETDFAFLRERASVARGVVR